MKQYIITIIPIFMILFTGCEKDPDLQTRDYNYVVTLKEKNNNSSGVTLTGDIYFMADSPVEYGFVMDKAANPSIADYVIVKSGTPDIGEYSQRIGIGLESGTDYYVRAYIKSDTKLVYGNEIQFQSNGSAIPELNDFSPQTGRAGDIVEITGKNFCPYPAWNHVMFDNKPATVISATQSMLVVSVPVIAESREVSLSIWFSFQNIAADDKFQNVYP